LIYQPHLRTVATLPWEKSQVHNDNSTFSSIDQSYTLQLRSIKQHYPIYLHNQSNFMFNQCSECSKLCPRFSFTQA